MKLLRKKIRMAVGIDFIDGSWEKFECKKIVRKKNTIKFVGIYEPITSTYHTHEYPLRNIKKIMHTEGFVK